MKVIWFLTAIGWLYLSVRCGLAFWAVDPLLATSAIVGCVGGSVRALAYAFGESP